MADKWTCPLGRLVLAAFGVIIALLLATLASVRNVNSSMQCVAERLARVETHIQWLRSGQLPAEPLAHVDPTD